MTEIHNFGVDSINCHAWNKDRTQVAICPNNNEIQVYKHSITGWKLVETLQEHDMRIMGIDWAPWTNRIVTCSVDKNAYVWTQNDDGKWIPGWVLLRINRAATCVKWAPLENKFAVGSGGRVIAVCYFEPEHNWWLCKHIKRSLRSTVTTIDWHRGNKLLVAGSTDYKVRVFSAFITDVEGGPDRDDPWGYNPSFGTLLAEFSNTPNGGGWIHSVAFSPCGNKVCWVAHNSSICIADATKGKSVVRLYTEHLPFLRCIWISSNYIVAVGHSCIPMLYSIDDNGQIHFVSKLDNTQKKEAAGLSAMRKFQSLDRQARNDNDNALDSVHQNTINCVRQVSKTEFSTSSLDGQLVVWNLQTLGNSIAGLQLQ